MIFWSILTMLLGIGLAYVGGAIVFRGHSELIDGCEKKEVREKLGADYARRIGWIELIGGAGCIAAGIAVWCMGAVWWAALAVMAACVIVVCAAVALCRAAMLKKSK